MQSLARYRRVRAESTEVINAQIAHKRAEYNQDIRYINGSREFRALIDNCQRILSQIRHQETEGLSHKIGCVLRPDGSTHCLNAHIQIDAENGIRAIIFDSCQAPDQIHKELNILVDNEILFYFTPSRLQRTSETCHLFSLHTEFTMMKDDNLFEAFKEASQNKENYEFDVAVKN